MTDTLSNSQGLWWHHAQDLHRSPSVAQGPSMEMEKETGAPIPNQEAISN